MTETRKTAYLILLALGAIIYFQSMPYWMGV
jgi:hypothetical protein